MNTTKMCFIVTSVTWSVCACVCLLNITVRCAKTAVAIEMPFGAWTLVGPRNHEAKGPGSPPRRKGIFSDELPRCDAAFRQNSLIVCVGCQV